ncbi:MAG: hypothetical protein JWN71_2839 [Xanthobacteraceae bacterium]|nr:hypothetical protein [Xanthobacteraceae bacterium]
MMTAKSKSSVNPRLGITTEWAITEPRASDRIANNTVRSAMNKIATTDIATNNITRKSIAIRPSKASRHGVPLSPPERARHEAEFAAANAADRHALGQKARRNGMKRRQVRAADGSVQEVWSFASSFHAMGFQDHQIAAAERLAAEWQSAYRALRAQTYEPAVDGGRPPHGPHLAQVSAQARLAACKQYLGQRAYDIAVAVAIYGATAREIHALGGKEHRTVKSDMDVAFNELDAFYTNTRRKDRTWTAVEEFIRGRADMIREGER